MKEKSLKIARICAALSDPTRLRILSLLGAGELSVTALVEELALSQPKVSRHLGVLRSAALVDLRREGKWMHYRLALRPKSAESAIVFAVLSGLVPEAQGQPLERMQTPHSKAAANALHAETAERWHSTEVWLG